MTPDRQAAPSGTMSSAAPTVPTYVVGHRNPDADASCSAIGYASFKERSEEHTSELQSH